MSDTGPATPPSGTENPSRFMMGVEGTEDDQKFEEAVESFFSKRPEDAAKETSEDTSEDTGEQGQEGSPGQGQEQGGEEGGQEVGEGVDGPEGAPSPEGTGAPSDDTTADFAALFQARYGKPPSRAELEGLFSLAEWANGLTPEQQAAIQAAYLGYAPSQQQAPPEPKPDPLIEEYGDDPTIGPLVQRIADLQANLERIAESNAQSHQQQVIEGLGRGAEAFKTERGVSDLELQALQGAVASQGLLPGFVNAYGDPTIAMQKALDHLYWQTPTFQQREIAKAMEAQKQNEKTHTERKRKAASVTGTGGNGASRTDPAPKTTEDRWANVAAELASAMRNGQPG